MRYSPAPLRDILLFDLETSGVNVAEHGILQIGAVILDQVSFEERAHFDLHVRLPEDRVFDPDAEAVHKIPELVARSAHTPDLATALAEFRAFADPADVTLAAWNATFDYSFLQEAYRRIGEPFPYNFHVLELWSLAWLTFPDVSSPILAKTAEALGVEKRHQHDALADARTTADVLRAILARERAGKHPPA